MKKRLFALSWKVLLVALSATDPGPIKAAVLPQITRVGAAVLTNECHASFSDPGVTVQAGPAAISAGNDFNLALTADGRAIQWGFNPFNILSVPPEATNVVDIVASEGWAMALRMDGTVVAWGHRLYGQTNVPAYVTNVVKLVGGEGRGVAIRGDGSLAAWGSGFFGETNVPQHVTNIVSVGNGIYHVVAANAQGNVFAWGRGLYGTTNVPIEATNVISVASGYYHNLALRADGTVVGWGAGSTNRRDYPDFGQTIIPADATNVVAISSSAYHCLALKADGTVVAWGQNNRGQTNVPPGISNVVAVSAGAGHSLLLKADGTIIGLGNNQNGELSIPTNLITSDLAVTVSGSVNTNVPGTYTLTYTATNILGEVGTTTRTVVVVDTTPPSLDCPMNIIVEWAGINGAPVFFAAQAADLCSGQVSVSFIPASGSTFPIGTNIVTCTAMDDSGNSSLCSFTVTVEAGQTVKRNVLAEMTDMERLQSRNGRGLLDTAIAQLNESLNANFWIDQIHLNTATGREVFSAEARAVLTLHNLYQKNDSIDVHLQDWINRLVRVDRLLAAEQIEVAIQTGATLAQLANASEKLAEGDQAATQNRPWVAIHYYEYAWKEAIRLTSKTPATR